jgi:hypothetical protein
MVVRTGDKDDRHVMSGRRGHGRVGHGRWEIGGGRIPLMVKFRTSFASRDNAVRSRPSGVELLVRRGKGCLTATVNGIMLRLLFLFFQRPTLLLLSLKVNQVSTLARRTFRPKPRAVHPRPDLPRMGFLSARALRLRVMSGNGACFLSFRECSHYGPPETLFAFGKRLIPATHPTMQYYIGPGRFDGRDLGVTASDISPYSPYSS